MKPTVEMIEADGKTCDPRLKSHLIAGSDRDAGWDWSSGTSKKVNVTMPPDAIKAVAMEMTSAWDIVN